MVSILPRAVGALSRVQTRAKEATPAGLHSIRLSGSPGGGAAAPLPCRLEGSADPQAASMASEASRTILIGPGLSFPPQRFEPPRHFLAGDQGIETRVHPGIAANA